MAVVRAENIEIGDRINKFLVTDSRPYLPNPEIMWLLMVRDENDKGDCWFIKRTRCFEVTFGLTIDEEPS